MNATEYRFQFQIVSEEEVPCRRTYLPPGTYRVGASADADIYLPVEGVSRNHAILDVLPDGGAVLQDLDSRNGTWIGSRRVLRAALIGGERLAFGSLVAELVALDPVNAGIAIAPADPARSATPPAAALERSVHSTLGSSFEERLIRSLSAAASRRSSQNRGVEARRLALEWLEILLLDRVEICRNEVLLAACGAERSPPPAVEVGDSAGISIVLWGPDAPRLERLRPLLEIGRALLDPAPSRTVTRTEATADHRLPPRMDDPPALDLPGAGSLDPRMIQLCRRAAKVAKGEVPILIRGESGVGKEVVARWIHQRSPRASAPFVALNCAALPRELLEAELFGIEKGVATGVERRRGMLEEASGGTLFLDEIGDMAADTQAKVLRVLESRTLFRVGGRAEIEVDVRFIAATHRDLDAAIAAKAFRLDLYHRLASFVAEIPPLRERRRDIALYAAYFLERELRRNSKDCPGMTRAALGALIDYRWPGNVRELENQLRTAVLLLEPAEPLDVIHLSGEIRPPEDDRDPPSLRLDRALRKAEREAFDLALTAADHDHGEAIANLGVSRATFYRKLKELGLVDRRQSQD